MCDSKSTVKTKINFRIYNIHTEERLTEKGIGHY